METVERLRASRRQCRLSQLWFCQSLASPLALCMVLAEQLTPIRAAGTTAHLSGAKAVKVFETANKHPTASHRGGTVTRFTEARFSQ